MKPLFIIAGAPKCATTALWAYLNEHPDVSMSSIKEPRFFTRAPAALKGSQLGEGLLYGGTYDKGFRWYESLFNDRADVKLFGEATAHYFVATDAPELIFQYAPETKLIFLLRHPVDRLYSHYWQDYKIGLSLPDFEAMFKDNHPRLTHYVNVSKYKMHLERFHGYFPMNQMLILLDADLKKEPTASFSRITQFLGIDESFFPSALGKKYNEHTLPRWRWIDAAVTQFRNSKIAHMLPEEFRLVLARARRQIARVNTTKMDYPELSSTLRYQLLKEFTEDVDYVESILHRPLPDWRE
jgi:hypothetical protein